METLSLNRQSEPTVDLQSGYVSVSALDVLIIYGLVARGSRTRSATA